ncbi:hypothetical protein CKO51_18895 [Rhodopirellula sp. SM50]|nr:hypothetical protein CKO51_18895 [Rhodopirellula sp. SM50]
MDFCGRGNSPRPKWGTISSSRLAVEPGGDAGSLTVIASHPDLPAGFSLLLKLQCIGVDVTPMTGVFKRELDLLQSQTD